MQKFEWLTRVLKSAGVSNANSLPADLGQDIEQAWNTAAERLHLSLEDLARLVAAHYGVAIWDGVTPRLEVASRLPERFCRLHRVLPVEQRGDELVIATSEPDRPDMLAQLRFVIPTPVRFVIAPPQQIALHAMEAFSSVDEMEMGGARGLFDLDAPQDVDVSASIQLVNSMLREAIQLGASDMHLQPMMGGGEVRFRVDGVLQRMGLMPRAALQRVIGRFKAVAGMDTTNRLHPHDGHARVRHDGASYDLRLSTVPSDGAEKLVVRFLARLSVSTISALDIEEPELSQLTQLLDHGLGLMLITGPTGSGKTTTLYAALAERNRVEVNIATVEEPVEYHIPRLTQIEVNPKTGMSFAMALRAVLRQDPDILLIGEIRDPETAAIAVRAAMIGRLVLATLHTYDAMGAVSRLVDLGVSPGLLSEALIGASAQRLMRKLCTVCTQPAIAPYTQLERWLMKHAAVAQPMRAVGCSACRFRGFRGRLMISQVFNTDAAMTEAIAQHVSHGELTRMAVAGGMRSLAASALSRVRHGLSTPEEAQRVIGRQIWDTLADEMGVPKILSEENTSASPSQSMDADDVGRPGVLVLARQPEQREALRGILERAGFSVDTVGELQLASDWLAEGSGYQLAVLDVEGLVPELLKAVLDMHVWLPSGRLPQGDELLQALLDLRARLPGAMLPVLAITENARSSQLVELAREEGVLLATRPTTEDEWISLINQTAALSARAVEI